MLTRASNLIGASIVTLQQGKKIGQAWDLYINPYLNKITAFLVTPGNWFFDPKVLVFEDVQSSSADFLITDSRSNIKPLPSLGKQMEHSFKGIDYFSKTQVLTTSGKNLGKVSDLFFDNQTGLVEQLEIKSDGDGYSGKTIFSVKDIVTVGNDAILVEETQMPLVPKIRPEYERRHKEEESAVFYQQITLPKTKRDPKKSEDAVGLFLTKNILNLDDKLIAKRGEMITHKLLDKAEEEGVLDQLLRHCSP